MEKKELTYAQEAIQERISKKQNSCQENVFQFHNSDNYSDYSDYSDYVDYGDNINYSIM